MSAIKDTTLDELIGSEQDLNAMRRSLETNGAYIIDEFYDAEFCKKVIGFIESYEEPDREVNYGGSEKRIWKSEDKLTEIERFRADADELLTRVLGEPHAAYSILAIENKIVDPTKFSLGRWHLDSIKKQYKVFVFLTDVTDASGPFEYLPGSHKSKFKLQLFLNNGGLGDIFKKLTGAPDRFYTRLDDKVIAGFSKYGYAPRPVICNRGSVMIVDTTAVHRARPALRGERYALTAYYR